MTIGESTDYFPHNLTQEVTDGVKLANPLILSDEVQLKKKTKVTIKVRQTGHDKNKTRKGRRTTRTRRTTKRKRKKRCCCCVDGCSFVKQKPVLLEENNVERSLEQVTDRRVKKRNEKESCF
jgi:hypothetical protein